MAGGFWTMLWHTTFLRHKSEEVYTFLHGTGGYYQKEVLYECECGKKWWD
jgi:hypothetical protein